MSLENCRKLLHFYQQQGNKKAAADMLENLKRRGATATTEDVEPLPEKKPTLKKKAKKK